MPGLIKVGRTARNPVLRTMDDDLASTGIPTPFKVEYYAWFDNMWEAERKAHRALSDYHHGKEFFKTDTATAIHKIENLNLKFTKLFSKRDDDEKVKLIFKKTKIDYLQKIEKFWQANVNYRDDGNENSSNDDTLIQSCKDFIHYSKNLSKTYPDIIDNDALRAAYYTTGRFILNKLKSSEDYDVKSYIDIVEESIQWLKKALNLKSKDSGFEDAEILTLIGVAYSFIRPSGYKKGIDSDGYSKYLKTTIKYFNKAIESNPNYAHVYKCLAEEYNSYEYSWIKKKKAIECYNKAIELTSDSETKEKHLKEIKIIESRINSLSYKARAIEKFMEGIKSNPEKKEAYFKEIHAIDPSYDIAKQLVPIVNQNKVKKKKCWWNIF